MSWIRTYTGQQHLYDYPAGNVYALEDIAHGLSLTCRFSGQCRRFYSVAEHCLHVADLAPQRYKAFALLHDAAEAYICDIPGPLKSLCSEYRDIEWDVEHSIYDQLLGSVPSVTARRIIKRIDRRLLKAEALALITGGIVGWRLGSVKSCDIGIECWPSRIAERKYLANIKKELKLWRQNKNGNKNA